MERRRPEILDLFRQHVYGRSPGRPPVLAFESTVDPEALGGTAVRKQVAVRFSERDEGPRMDILIYLPSPGSGPVIEDGGVFGGYWFVGGVTASVVRRLNSAVSPLIQQHLVANAVSR